MEKANIEKHMQRFSPNMARCCGGTHGRMWRWRGAGRWGGSRLCQAHGHPETGANLRKVVPADHRDRRRAVAPVSGIVTQGSVFVVAPTEQQASSFEAA